MKEKFFGAKLFSCAYLNGAQLEKLVYDAGGAGAFEQQGGRETAELRDEVVKDMQPYIDQIDAADNKPEELERILEKALGELADRYSTKLEDGRKAQRAALGMLVDRACDIDGDGKLSTPDELKLRAEILADLAPVAQAIDKAAADTGKELQSIAQLAREMKRETLYGVSALEDNDLADSDDPGVKNAYANLEAAKLTLAQNLTQYGLRPDMEINADNVLMALDGLADRGNATYKKARAKGELPAFAEQIAAELGQLHEDVLTGANRLVQAIDAWQQKAVAQAREGYAKGRVEASELVQRIDATKVRILAENTKQEVVGRAKEGATKAANEAESRLATLQMQLDAATARQDNAKQVANEKLAQFNAQKGEYGLLVSADLTEDNVLMALDRLADRGNETYKKARAKSELPDYATKIYDELRVYERESDAATSQFRQEQYEVSRLERAVGKQQEALGKVQAEGERVQAEAAEQSYDVTARLKLEGKKSEVARRKAPVKPRIVIPDGVVHSSDASSPPGVSQAGAQEALETPQVVEYTVKPNDSITKITKAYYGTANVEFALALQKQLLGTVERLKTGGDSLIRVGQILKLPASFQGRERKKNN